MTIREMIEPLTGLYQLDVIEKSGGLTFCQRHGVAALSLSGSDLVEQQGGDFERQMAQADDLPAVFSLLYLADGGTYDPAVTQAQSFPVAGSKPVSQGQVTLDLPIVLGEDEAEIRAHNLLTEAALMGEQMQFTLPPAFAGLEVGDVVEFDKASWRIVEMHDGEAREILATRTAADIYGTFINRTAPIAGVDRAHYGAPVFELLDLPVLPGADDQAELHVATFSDPWPGRLAIYQGPDISAALTKLVSSPAIMGRIEGTFAPGPCSRWDHGATLKLRLLAGALASRQELDVLAGANMLAVLSDTGAYEICQFRDAQLLGDGSWMLSGFLRGLAGTEVEATAGASDGARVVVLETTDRVAFGLDSRGLDIPWQAGPADQAPGGATFTGFVASFDGLSRRPLSPVHLRASRQGGDVSLSWVRRTRIGGDSWNAPEVPLGETQERYLVTISGPGSPSLYEIDRSDWVYSAAAQALDGNANAGFSVTIAQISDSFGPGAAASIVVLPL